MRRGLLVTLALAMPAFTAHARAADEERADVLVYGATPSGIAAALSAGREGRRVLLVEPGKRIGGLTTNGLSHPDFRTFEGITGTYRDFTSRVHRWYADKYGPESVQAQESLRGTHAEPHVNLLVFEKMLAEQPTVTVRKGLRLGQVKTTTAGKMKHVESVTFASQSNEELVVRATIVIDATYEGDLMAGAGVAYRVGREARAEYGESLAPEKADGQVQGYNFRLTMTPEEGNRVPPSKPEGYRREDFLPLVPLLKEGKFKSVFCYPTGGIYKAHDPRLPNNKYDINDVSRGLVRLSLPDINDPWPDGDAAVRERIFQEHVRHNLGMLYFLQNDEAVPQAFQDEARKWGLCKDEFVETGHLPEMLYVREARRMVGVHVFTEADTNHAPGDARSVLHRDAVAMGDYGPNCHGTAHEGPRIGGKHTGEFYKSVPPYQVPYGVLVPRECDNLLSPVACSSSHVGFCALRLEPIWASLGQAAGYAAHVALKHNVPVQRVEPAKVQNLLHKTGAATIYVSDVLPDSKDFAAVQWWGTRGGLHGLNPQPETPGKRGPHLRGQYYHAYPGHAAELDRVLDDDLRARWNKLAGALGIPAEKLASARTRGDFIRAAHGHVSASGGR